MSDLSARLREYGGYLDVRFPDVGIEELRNLRVLTPRTPTGRQRSKAVAFAAAAAVTVLVIGGTALLTFLITRPEPPVTGVGPPLPPPVTIDPTTTVAGSTVPPATAPTTTTSSIPPTSTTAPAAAFLSCERLAERGNSYGRVVAYWGRNGSPDELDPDGNGIPCETHYAPVEVEALYGGPGALEVIIAEELTTWTAAGPAVDAGLICPSGTKIEDGDYRVREPWLAPAGTERYPDAFARLVDMRLVCDDGTGEITLGFDLFFEWTGGGLTGPGGTAGGEAGAWYVVAGTGRYERLTGGGFYHAILSGPREGRADAVGRVGLDDGQ